MEIDENQLLRDTEFVSAEALNAVHKTHSPEARAQFLIAAQLGNLAKAIMNAGLDVRWGLKWISDSIDNHVPQQEPTEENDVPQQEPTEENDGESFEGESGEGEGEDGTADEAVQQPDGVSLTYVDGEFVPANNIPLVERPEQTRKRYVRSVDGLKLERVCD